MSIILEEIENVTVRREAYSPLIRIIGNPVSDLESTILLDMQRLEYHDDVLVHTTPKPALGETVADFIGREFNVNGKVITGMDVMLVVKAYVATMHAEHESASEPTPG